ncbi:MAG: o-succinylbenzoate--CoA ligase, partial [Lysinibacillus sp.]
NWIKQRAYMTPHKIGLSFGEQQWTFLQLHEQSQKVAMQLAALHIKQKERVAVIGPSTPQLIHIMYGCMQLQLEMVLLNNRLSEQELHYQIEDSNVSYVLVADEFKELVHDERVVYFSEILTKQAVEVELASEWDGQHTTAIMYTSGTTGFPKGVRLTLENHKTSALASALNLGIGANDSWLCAVPIFHISGFSILMRSLLYGMTVRLYEKFDAAASAQEIAAGTVTYMSVVNVTLERIVSYMEEHQLVAHEKFATMLAGGGPIAEQFLRRAERLQLRVAQTYGMTETASQSATLSAEDAFEKVGSAGKPLFFYQIRIDGATKAGQAGEICIKGKHVTPGYIGRFSDKQSTIDGWLFTGDIGYLDEEGYLYVLDRRSDLIISGGENVYPAEIENVLLAHPDVLEAGVCGVPHDVWGQVPAAYVVTKQSISKQQLMEFCKVRLAAYKLPKSIHFVNNLPRNGSNKLVRRKLKDL